MLGRDSCLSCTQRGQLWTALTAALLVLVQDQLLDPVHRLLASQHRPHHHLDLLVADPGGAAGQGAAGVAAPALASDGEEGKLVHVKLNVKVQVMVRNSVHGFLNEMKGSRSG